MQVSNQTKTVGPVIAPSLVQAPQRERVVTKDQGLVVIIPSSLFPDFGDYFDQYDARRDAVASSNSQAVSDAKRAVNQVIAYYRSIGVTPEEGASDIDVEFDPKFPNAAYDPESDRMIIGVDPRTGKSFAQSSPDVVAHELGHRVATGTGMLGNGSNTEGENGAVQEHVADVLASAFDKSNWTIGEVAGFESIRDMQNPNSLGHPESVAQLDAIMKHGGRGIVVAEKDQFGRTHRAIDWHNVAEIPNHAAYEIAQTIGRDDLAKLYLNAMRKYIAPDAGLSQLAKGVEQSAADIYGTNSRAFQATQDAFVAAGLLKRA
jgi:Zn-dependent metalloprotease